MLLSSLQPHGKRPDSGDKTEARLRFLINLVYYAAVCLLIYIGYKYVLGLLLPFVLAFGLVSLVRPVINWLNKHMKIRHAVISISVVATVYILVGAGLFGLIMLVVNLLQRAVTEFTLHFNTVILPSLTQAWSNILSFLERYISVGRLAQYFDWNAIDWPTLINDNLSSMVLGGATEQASNFFNAFRMGVPAFFIGFVFTIMLSFFIGIQYDRVIQFLHSQLPDRAKLVMADLRSVMLGTIFNYIKAYMTLMTITFVELSVGLLVLRTQNAILIAAGIAVFDALPVFGTGAIVIPWIIVELIRGNVSYAVGLIFVYAIITVVRNIIEPKIVGDKLGLNPIVSMVAIYLGFRVKGIVGMVVMPILTQILLELHNKGSISILRRQAKAAAEEPEDPGEGTT